MSTMTFIAWIAGVAVGYFATWGIPALNALMVSGVIYYVGELLIRARKVSYSHS